MESCCTGNFLSRLFEIAIVEVDQWTLRGLLTTLLLSASICTLGSGHYGGVRALCCRARGNPGVARFKRQES